MPHSWTDVELAALCEDEDSCVYLEKGQKHLGLHPFHLTNLNAALREILDAKLNFFEPELNGILLAYRNTKLLSPLGYIMYDTCFVHVDIKADFYVFRPEVGRSLKGFVNKKSTNHIGILVHKVFNVSIPKPDNEEAEEIENQINWPGDKVSVGQEVRFTLEKLDYKTSLPYLRGVLDEDEYLSGCHLFNEQIADNCESEFQKVARWSGNGDQDNKPRLKTENKKIIFNSDSEVEIDPDSGSDKKKSIKKLVINSDVVEKPPKNTKKTKRKSRLNSESDSESTEQSNKEQKALISQNLLLNKSDCNEFIVSKDRVKKRKKHSVEGNKLLSQHESFNNSNGAEGEVLNEKIKNHKKKSKRDTVDNDTEDERKQKSLIKNLIIPTDQTDSVSKENQLISSKRLKKSIKNTNGTSDTEDEKQFKLTINKNIFQNNIVETKLESDLQKKPKKRKRSLDEKYPTTDTDDNENNKLSHENGFQIPESLPKKRKKKHSVNDMADDSEAEKKYKKSLISNLLENVETKQLNNSEFQVPKVTSKKERNRIIKDDVLMDTEDERNYKSSLKTLVQTLQTDNHENNIKHKKHKKKRDKEKRKSSITSENTPEFNPLLVKVKDEPESEIEGKQSRKEKQKLEHTDSLKNNINSNVDEEFNKMLKRQRKKLEKERKSKLQTQDKFVADGIKDEKPEKIETFEENNKETDRLLNSNENSESVKKKNSVKTLLEETAALEIKTEEEQEARIQSSKKKRNKESSK